MKIEKTVADQIEAAFDYRGHVTLRAKGGRVIEGYLFNRELNPLKGDAYVEMIPKDTDERVRLPASEVESVTLTGKDFAVPFTPQPK